MQPTVIILFLDGVQYSFERVGTGTKVVKISTSDIPYLSNLSDSEMVEIAVINGGDSEGGDIWEGGEILERVELTVEVDE